ncbi:MAG: cyclic nucleotide-binding domain-containing protein [Gammaproteobacteria bacterium]|nr:cyclic nucleotide-binding domain-containing protein [Gammaproteobacteria bacterium]MCF6363763.1 cyclic nucleotide-binding domain-containing protein [Gammaproteobacteria bacterium]
MSAAKQLLDHKLLKSLSPLCDLSPDMLTELNAKSRVEQVVKGATIFKRGDRDQRTLYLISGKLELTDANGHLTMLTANTPQASKPIDGVTPRRVSATAKTAVTLLNVDTSLLEMLLNWGQKQGYQVSNIEAEKEEEEDWMSRFLQSKVFLKLRAENIQAMMMRMEEMTMHAGDVVIKQGDTDDNYYIIAKGRARVVRKVSPDAPSMKLATLDAGTGFGEEALISNGSRNATVTMEEDGCLMRLSKEDFISLLVTPVLQYLPYEKAKAMQSVDVEWLDVRKLSEYSRGSLPGARNMSLAELRLGLRKLNKLHKYIVFSNHTHRAAAAVFLLNQQGLDAFVLSDGLTAVPRADLVESVSAKPESLPEPTAPDNVVTLPGAPAASAESDGRVEALMNKAKTRVQQEMRRTQAAEEARTKAQTEVARLKAEAEAVRKKAEEQARMAADRARSEAERQAAQQRAEAMARQQAETEAAAQRAEAEAVRAEMAEQARLQAESEIEKLKQESAVARGEVEEQIRRSAEQVRQETEKEISRLKSEAELARHRAQEQASVAADKARSEAERELARQRAEAMAGQQDEVEKALKTAEQEAMRTQQAEEARRHAEEEMERMRLSAAETQRQMEEQAHLAADQARSEAEREAARIRAEELAIKQAEIEAVMEKADSEAERASAAEEAKARAETEVARLKSEAEAARIQAEQQARVAADQARSEAEREAARMRAEEMARQQAKIEGMASRAEEESLRAQQAEEARKRAEAEIERLKVDAEVARMQVEEQVQRVADAARGEAEREAARAKAAEEARLQAEAERDKLVQEAEQARLQAEVQARMAADQARSEAERDAARIRAEALAQQQAELEVMASRAEEEAQRAQVADEARQRAEREIALRQEAADEAARKAAEEARRAQEAEQARQAMEEELASMRAEAEAARAQVERQARLFAAAQRLEAEEVAGAAEQQNMQTAARAEVEQAQEALAQQKEQLQQQEAEAELARIKLAQAEAARIQQEEMARLQQEEAERVRAEGDAIRQRLEEEAEQRKREVEETARMVREEAERSKAAVEEMRLQAEMEIKRLKAEAEAARFQTEIEIKRSQAQVRKEAGQKQVKARAAEKARHAAESARRRKQVDQKRVQRQREAREQALNSLGEGGLDDFLSDNPSPGNVQDVSGDAALSGSASPANRPDTVLSSRQSAGQSNLIDEAEVMRVDPQARKSTWVSDDFIWEAALGYRKDPNVEVIGSPAGNVDVEEAKPIPASVEKPATATAQGAESATFSSTDIDHKIRPQAIKPSGKPARKGAGKGRLGLMALGVVLAAGVGYVMISDDTSPQLKQLVGKGAESLDVIENKVSSTLSTWKGGEGSEKSHETADKVGDTETAIATVAPVVDSEEKMAKLRQRLETIRGETEQKALEQALQAARREAELSLNQSAGTVAVSTPADVSALQAEATDAASLQDVMQALEAEAVVTENRLSESEPVADAETGVIADVPPVVEDPAFSETTEFRVAVPVSEVEGVVPQIMVNGADDNAVVGDQMESRPDAGDVVTDADVSRPAEGPVSGVPEVAPANSVGEVSRGDISAAGTVVVETVAETAPILEEPALSDQAVAPIVEEEVVETELEFVP